MYTVHVLSDQYRRLPHRPPRATVALSRAGSLPMQFIGSEASRASSRMITP
jgi:hypothetical protein